MKDTNLTVTLAPNDAKALQEAAEAKYPGKSPKTALRAYVEDVLAQYAFGLQRTPERALEVGDAVTYGTRTGRIEGIDSALVTGDPVLTLTMEDLTTETAYPFEVSLIPEEAI